MKALIKETIGYDSSLPRKIQSTLHDLELTSDRVISLIDYHYDTLIYYERKGVCYLYVTTVEGYYIELLLLEFSTYEQMMDYVGSSVPFAHDLVFADII